VGRDDKRYEIPYSQAVKENRKIRTAKIMGELEYKYGEKSEGSVTKWKDAYVNQVLLDKGQSPLNSIVTTDPDGPLVDLQAIGSC
jgi:hypothetical protein